MRHRRTAQCRQIHAVQRADPDGGGAGGQLSLLHHRAQCRRCGGARSAAGDAWRRSPARAEIIPTRITFVDIAGLVRGASKGEGLGNQFLATIREVDAVAHVLRCFEDDDITHVEGRIDPIGDAEVVETELMLADLESLEKRIKPLEKKANSGEKEAKEQLALMMKAVVLLREGKPARLAELAPEERGPYSQLGLMTAKPVLYVCNVEEGAAATGNDIFPEGRSQGQGRRRPRRGDLRQDRGRNRPDCRTKSARISWTRIGPGRARPQPHDPRRL